MTPSRPTIGWNTQQGTEQPVDHAFSASAFINKRLEASLRAFCERRQKEPFPYLILAAR